MNISESSSIDPAKVIADLLGEAVKSIQPLCAPDSERTAVPAPCRQFSVYLQVAEECWKRVSQPPFEAAASVIVMPGVDSERSTPNDDLNSGSLVPAMASRKMVLHLLHSLEPLILAHPGALEMQRMIRLAEVLRYYDRRFRQLIAQLRSYDDEALSAV